MAELRGVIHVTLIGLGCAAALVVVRHGTEQRIDLNETRALRAELLALTDEPTALPRHLPDLDVAKGLWRLCDGTLLVRSEASGYGGPLSLLYTVLEDPPRLGRLRLTSHQETPGITDFLRDSQGWVATLSGRTANGLQAVATVSGATITSRALRDHLAGMLATGQLETADTVEGCDP